MSWQVSSGWQDYSPTARPASLPGWVQPIVDRATVALTETLRITAALLTPFALVAASLWFWSLTADLGLSGDFFIDDGLFSHGQVWLALAVISQLLAVIINRRFPQSVRRG